MVVVCRFLTEEGRLAGSKHGDWNVEPCYWRSVLHFRTTPCPIWRYIQPHYGKRTSILSLLVVGRYQRFGEKYCLHLQGSVLKLETVCLSETLVSAVTVQININIFSAAWTSNLISILSRYFICFGSLCRCVSENIRRLWDALRAREIA
jgi:hypothetical protein